MWANNEIILQNLYSHCDTYLHYLLHLLTLRTYFLTYIVLNLLYLLYLTYLLTHSMEQGPSSEVTRSSASEKHFRILWTPTVHSVIHRCPPPVPILSQIDLVHALHIPLQEDPS